MSASRRKRSRRANQPPSIISLNFPASPLQISAGSPSSALSHMLSSFGGTNIRTPPKLAASHRLCPHCVVEDLANGGEKPSTRPYVRYQWLASGIHHCLVHGNALLNLDAGDFQYDFAGFVDRYYDQIAARADLKSPVKATPVDIYASERLARKQLPRKLNAHSRKSCDW